MKKNRIFNKMINRLQSIATTPEIPDLSENNQRYCQKCHSELVSVSGVIQHVDFVTGDIFLPARCVTCGEPGLAQYSLVKCVNDTDLKERVCLG